MRIDISREWCLRMAQLEGDTEIGAGALAGDPVFDSQMTQVEPEYAVLAFGRFVRLMRRNRGLTVERLAEDADLDIAELLNIEEDAHYKPELRTVHQLAGFFGVQRAGLLQIAGLTTARDNHLVNEAIRFAARSEPTVALTADERSALEAFVSVLAEQK